MPTRFNAFAGRTRMASSFQTTFLERIEFISQVAESYADDGNDDVGNGRPEVQHFDEQFQTKVIDEDVADGDKQIPDNLCPAAQGGTREADVARHPEASQEGNWELEDEGRDVGRESNKSEVENLGMEDEMIENVVQRPFEAEVETSASRVTKQFEDHHFAERRIEKIDDRSQSALDPGFYVFDCRQVACFWKRFCFAALKAQK